MKHVLSRLLGKGVRLHACQDELKVLAGDSPLSDTEKAALKKHKQDILAYLQGRKIACLSHAQERLWYLDQLGLGFQYHIPAIGMIEGRLNTAALQQAIDYIVRRHESLRTNFSQLEGTPAQLVREIETVPIESVESGSLTDPRHKALVQSFIDRPFDLEEDLLLRAMLVRLSDATHALCFSMHHIVSDGWSMRVLIADLARAYEAYCRGEAPADAPLQLQYTGYCVWQRSVARRDEREKQLDYWKKRLTGYQNLKLPTDFARPAQLSGRGNIVSLDIDRQTGQALKTFSRNRRTTSFTVFMAAVYLMLRRYSGQTDICLGMPVANRAHRRLEDVVGLFVNTLVMRIDPPQNGDLTVDELLQTVHERIVEGQDNQELPIEEVLAFLQPQRDAARSPIFQVLVNYTPLIIDSIAFGECSLKPSFDFEVKSAKFDLTFTMNEYNDGSGSIYVEYSSDLFHEATVSAMCRQLSALMRNMMAEPGRTLGGISWLSQQELHAITVGRNRTQADYPQDSCVHELFEACARANPQRIAVVFGDRSVTYRELDVRSTRLAARLQSKGVQPDQLVAVCVERSPEMIVAVLGILKAGGAYLPIDPAYPGARINTVLCDSQTRILLTQSELYAMLTPWVPAADCEMLALEQLVHETASEDEPVERQVNPGHLAYVIYTSGSTGRPKGVMVEHRSVVNHNLAAIAAYRIGAQDRLLQFSTISFDIFVEEVFPTLLSAATLVLLDARRFTQPDYLKFVIERENISIVNFPTAFWSTLVDECFAGCALRTVVVGGEKLDNNVLARWYRNNPDIEVINTYGPTEATVIASLYPTTRETRLDKPVPIGRPIANTRLYILDAEGCPVPDGVVGELYIGGAGVARGYLHDPELTRAAFIDNPFEPHTRLYKTGDLVRWLPDGNIEYLARNDDQVKIRGFRVECGEIEALLCSYPGVQAAAVVVTKSKRPGLLVAYYASAGAVDEQRMRAFLAEQLPDYMLPAAVVALDSLPLTANGKVDRGLLSQRPVVFNDRPVSDAPESELQRELAALWGELLGTGLPGLDDNFFDMGGHSLLSVQLVARINQYLDRPGDAAIRVADILRYPTVRELSQHIEATRDTAGRGVYTVTLRDAVPGFIVPGMPGLSDGYHRLAQCLPGDGPVYGLQMQGYAGDAPASSIEAMAAHNIRLISDIRPRGKIRLFAHSYGGTVVYEMLRQMQLTDLDAENIVLIDSTVHFRQDSIGKDSVMAFCDVLMTGSGATSARLRAEIEQVLSTESPENWKTCLPAMLMQAGGGVDETFFASLWDVVERSLTLDYTPSGQLEHQATLVIANDSRSWLSPGAWDAYYDQVRVIHTPGDHMSVVTDPLCEQWINRL